MGDEGLREKLHQGFGAYLKPAAFRGRLCFGPGEGQRVRFTRPDVWLGREIERQDGDAALREIARRYLAAHGPATREDLRRWWATTPAAAGKLLRSLEDAEEVDVEGEAMWMLASDAADAAGLGAASGVRLLPAFDQYVIAATLQAGHFLAGDFRDRIYRPQGWLSPVLLVDGVMAGVWRHERKGRRLVGRGRAVRAALRAVRGAAEAEAERLAAYLGGEARARLRVTDDEPDGRDQRAAQRHLDQRHPQRDLLEALADPGDQQQLGADDRVGDGQRGADVGDQERQRVREAADERGEPVMIPRVTALPRPVIVPSSERPSERPIEIAAPSAAARPTSRAAREPPT